MQPSQRCATLPSQLQSNVVDVSGLRLSVAASCRGSEGNQIYNLRSRREGGQDKESAGPGVSEIPPCATRPTSTRLSASGGGSDGKAKDDHAAAPADGRDCIEPSETNKDGSSTSSDNRSQPDAHGRGSSWWNSFFANHIQDPSDLLGAMRDSKVQDSSEASGECQFREVGRDVGNQHGRRDGRCRHAGAPQRQARAVKEKGARVFLHGSCLECPESPHLRSLKRSMVRGGWLLKAVMVLLTTAAQTPSSSMAWAGLGKPSGHLFWTMETQEWTSAISSTSMTSATSSAMVTEEGAAPSLPEGAIHCYIYETKDDLQNWATDHVGKSTALSKNQRKVVAASINKMDVAEVYSPPRVTKRARLHGLQPGWALDLATGWDFSKRSHRRAALKLISKTKPAAQPAMLRIFPSPQLDQLQERSG